MYVHTNHAYGTTAKERATSKCKIPWIPCMHETWHGRPQTISLTHSMDPSTYTGIGTTRAHICIIGSLHNIVWLTVYHSCSSWNSFIQLSQSVHCPGYRSVSNAQTCLCVQCLFVTLSCIRSSNSSSELIRFPFRVEEKKTQGICAVPLATPTFAKARANFTHEAYTQYQDFDFLAIG